MNNNCLECWLSSQVDAARGSPPMHWQIAALYKDKHVFSLGFNSCRESQMFQHPFCRLGLTARTALPSCPGSGWALPVDGGCWAHVTCLPLLSLLSLHPSCCFLKAQTNCVLRSRLTRLEPTEHLNRWAKHSSQLAGTPGVWSQILCPLLEGEGKPETMTWVLRWNLQ